MTPQTSGSGDHSVLRTPFRSRFEEADWARLCALGALEGVGAGEVLLRRGTRTSALYVVESGALEVVDPRTSPETVLDLLGPGHVAGEMSFVDGAVASADVRARLPSQCWRWGHEALRARLEEQPRLALAFYRALSDSIVARVRAVTTSAMVGGFGAAPAIDTDAAEVDRLAEALAAGLRLPESGGEGAEGVAAEGLAASARWFARAPRPRALRVGERLRALAAATLASSALAAAMLGRAPGIAAPEVRAHALAGRAEGDGVHGIALDRALLGLPTVRGWRWRDAEIAARAARALHPHHHPRALVVSLGPTVWSGPLRGALGSARITALELGTPRPEAGGAGSPPGLGPNPTSLLTSEILPISPLAFLRGQEPRVPGEQHLVIVDAPTDHLPDVVLAALLAWCARHLRAGGVLLVGYASPSEDAALLEHLLRWPTLTRRSQAAVALLPHGGHARGVAHPGDAAARVLTWVAP